MAVVEGETREPTPTRRRRRRGGGRQRPRRIPTPRVEPPRVPDVITRGRRAQEERARQGRHRITFKYSDDPGARAIQWARDYFAANVSPGPVPYATDPRMETRLGLGYGAGAQARTVTGPPSEAEEYQLGRTGQPAAWFPPLDISTPKRFIESFENLNQRIQYILEGSYLRKPGYRPWETGAGPWAGTGEEAAPEPAGRDYLSQFRPTEAGPQIEVDPETGQYAIVRGSGAYMRAAQLTAEAIFGPVYSPERQTLPEVMWIDIARMMPYQPQSQFFQDQLEATAGARGFETAEDFLTAMLYREDPTTPGRWIRTDPIEVEGYGGGGYGAGYYPAYSYGGGGNYQRTSPRGAYGLLNWRI